MQWCQYIRLSLILSNLVRSQGSSFEESSLFDNNHFEIDSEAEYENKDAIELHRT